MTEDDLKTKRVRLLVEVIATVPETCESADLYLDGEHISVYEDTRCGALDVAQGPVTWGTVKVEVIP